MAMDLNELLHEHQAAVMRAAAAGDGAERDNHFAKVAEYAERVRALRKIEPMPDTPNKAEGPPTIIYGTYAGDDAQAESSPPVASWEDEGGAVRHPLTPLPEGIEMKLVREYRVGPYVYQDLDLAVAEHLRQLAAADHGTA
ncbi:hypothetical protein K3163_06495 [Qipengyuania sp. 1NDW9]|uniref:hypothetical protein n=1 Tax=Qipengyuania xiapuensis TaxID=2867236 RepID=UPI001C86D45D|nr:hypothetical protein [Qipengyuania xiapuensis]MBX7492851.1 hypothetical protein [Qipengyuania xiapuensis]